MDEKREKTPIEDSENAAVFASAHGSPKNVFKKITWLYHHHHQPHHVCSSKNWTQQCIELRTPPTLPQQQQFQLDKRPYLVMIWHVSRPPVQSITDLFQGACSKPEESTCKTPPPLELVAAVVRTLLADPQYCQHFFLWKKWTQAKKPVAVQMAQNVVVYQVPNREIRSFWHLTNFHFDESSQTEFVNKSTVAK